MIDKQSTPDSKTGWKQRNDAGPHTATFPSGATLSFRIPDDSALLRAGRLPDELRTTAVLCAGHPGGAEGYMSDLVTHAIVDAEREQRVLQMIEHGLQIEHELVAEMLVQPKVTAEEVGRGDFPAMDIRMLLEFAERRRDTDAAGNRLPVIVLREWAGFRDELNGSAGAGEGGAGGDEPGVDVPAADGDQV